MCTKKEIENMVKEMLDADSIQPSQSVFPASMVNLWNWDCFYFGKWGISIFTDILKLSIKWMDDTSQFLNIYLRNLGD